MYFEQTNNRGPLFANVDKFFPRFVPNLNGWEWCENVPASVNHIRFENLKYIAAGDQTTANSCFVADEKSKISELKEIVNAFKPRMLIVNDIVNDNTELTNDGVDDDSIKTSPFVGVVTLVVLKHVLDASVLKFVSGVFPHLQKLYVYSVMGELDETVSFPFLKCFSIVQMSYKNLLLISAQNLVELDVYRVIDMPALKNKREPMAVSLVDISLLTRAYKTLSSLRIDSNLLWHLPSMLFEKSGCFDRFQCFGDVNIDENEFPLNQALAKKILKAQDVILPPNIIKIPKGFDTRRPLGVYNNDKHLDDYILNSQLRQHIKIYNVHVPHETILMRQSTIYANVNFLHPLCQYTWHRVVSMYLKVVPASFAIKREIVMKPNVPLLWPNYVFAVRNNTSISFSGNKLTLAFSCTSTATIMESVINVLNAADMLNELHTDGVSINELELILFGECKNEKIVRKKLKHLKNVSFGYRRVLDDNLSIKFEKLRF